MAAGKDQPLRTINEEEEEEEDEDKKAQEHVQVLLSMNQRVPG